VWGYAGQLSVAQLALGGVAGYTTTLLISLHDVNLVLAVLAGVGTAVLCSLLLGLASLRLHGFYFTILSVSFAAVFVTLVTNSDTAGRTAGLLVDRGRLPVVDIGGLRWDLDSGSGGFFALALVVFMAMHALAVLLRECPAGRAMFAVRDDEALASSLGIRGATIKILSFALSAVVASVAGILQIYSFRLIVPEFFSFHEALLSLLLLVVAGLGYTYAPAIGAVVYVVLYQAAPVEGEWRVGLLGVFVILIVLFFPDGIAGGIRLLARRASSLVGRAARWSGRSTARSDYAE